MESKTCEKLKAIHRRRASIHQGPEIIRRRAPKMKVVQPFQKNAAAEDLLRLKDDKKELKLKREREITATCINQTD